MSWVRSLRGATCPKESADDCEIMFSHAPTHLFAGAGIPISEFDKR